MHTQILCYDRRGTPELAHVPAHLLKVDASRVGFEHTSTTSRSSEQTRGTIRTKMPNEAISRRGCSR